MTGEQRLLLAFEMSVFARELSGQRIREQHPEWLEAQVARELLRRAFCPQAVAESSMNYEPVERGPTPLAKLLRRIA